MLPRHLIFFLATLPTTLFAFIPSLQTQSRTDLGATFSYYDYEEPSLSVLLKGEKIGIDYSVIKTLDTDHYIEADFRYAFGLVDYSSGRTGTAEGDPDWYYEMRLLLGRDFKRPDGVIVPYVGYGFRDLFNDGRGLSSTGAVGYRRESQYNYIPLGITYRMHFKQAVLASTIEYDWMFSGVQKTLISDALPYIPDQDNHQGQGFGLRGNIMYQQGLWSFGPYFQFWDIEQSKITTEYYTNQGTNYVALFAEPKNDTIEVGLKVTYCLF